MKRQLCYLASPLGFNEAGRYYYEHVYRPALSAVVDVVDPWELTSDAEMTAARATGRERELALEAGRRNAEAIRRCALLVAFLDGQEPDAGTVAEVGFAAGLGRRCFGLRTDLRESGEVGVRVNLQVESLIVQSEGFIASSLDELVTCLAQLEPAEASQPLLTASGA